mgnify:CR=1 FL=1
MSNCFYHIDSLISISDSKREYVSRGGEKLFHALNFFDIDPKHTYALQSGTSGRKDIGKTLSDANTNFKQYTISNKPDRY